MSRIVPNDALTDAERLASANARIADLEERVAALYRRLTDREDSLEKVLSHFLRADEMPKWNGAAEDPVDLVLTVKNTYDYLGPCLESVFANTDVPFHLYLNDNASDDPRTPALLREVRDRHPDRVTLFLQEKDLGFADAVNFMLPHTAHDVILVNADTAVPPGWASRLLWPIRHSGQRVASCTPMTNSGPYVAFPVNNVETLGLFENMELGALDRVFQTFNRERFLSMPSGYGFCMAMSRAALDDIGPLDAETFRPGYGEETDWCCRAGIAGFINAAVPNLFVYHKSGATMKRDGDDARSRLKESHVKIIRARYPNLDNRIHAFVDDPGYQAVRRFLLLSSCVAAGGGLDVVFGHDAASAAGERASATATQDGDTGEWRLDFRYRDWSGGFTSPNLNWVIKTLYRFPITDLRVGEMPPREDREKFAATMGRLATAMGIETVWETEA